MLSPLPRPRQPCPCANGGSPTQNKRVGWGRGVEIWSTEVGEAGTCQNRKAVDKWGAPAKTEDAWTLKKGWQGRLQ